MREGSPGGPQPHPHASARATQPENWLASVWQGGSGGLEHACRNSVTTGSTAKVGSQGASKPKVAAATCGGSRDRQAGQQAVGMGSCQGSDGSAVPAERGMRHHLNMALGPGPLARVPSWIRQAACPAAASKLTTNNVFAAASLLAMHLRRWPAPPPSGLGPPAHQHRQAGAPRPAPPFWLDTQQARGF